MALLLTVQMASITGCNKHTRISAHPIYAQTRIPFNEFIKTPLAIEASREMDGLFPFPEEVIFNGSGKMVFLGDSSRSNTIALHDILQLVKEHKKQYPLTLSGALENIPGLSSYVSLLSAQHNLTELSIFLDNCYGCSIQQTYLAKDQRYLLEHGVNMLVVHVSRNRVQSGRVGTTLKPVLRDR
jgi:hypothetical protein